MIVECPGCTTIFPVDPKKIPSGGINTRCSKCGEVFFIAEPEPEAMAPPEPTVVVPEEPAQPPEPEVEEEVGAEPEAGFEEEVEAEPDAPMEPESPPEPETHEPAIPEPEIPEEKDEEPEEDFGEMSDALSGAVAQVEEALEEVPPEIPSFGKRDPMDKAKRLARVLVSDIILYNPDRHQDATESGRVKEEFEEEIQKSWNEYVEQVGDEVANSTSFFNDALNEILAKGDKIF